MKNLSKRIALTVIADPHAWNRRTAREEAANGNELGAAPDQKQSKITDEKDL